MSTQENLDLVQRMLGAFQTGDLATVGSCFASDAVWDFPGPSIVSGVYKGPDEIVGFLARAFELSGGTLGLDLVDITASAKGATQVQWVRADHGGRSIRAIELIHHEIENGSIVHTWHRADEGAIAGFFGTA